MKKLKQPIYTLLLLLSLLLGGNVWGQYSNGESIPTVYQNIPQGNQSITSKTITTNETWYKWTNDSTSFSVSILLTTQGLNNKLSSAEFYKDNAGFLSYLNRDTIKNNKLFLFAKNTATNSSIYIKIVTLSTGCSTCTPANPIINLNTLNVTPGCNGYIQPNCEYVKDGSFEFFNLPCDAIDITNAANSLAFAPCFWQYSIPASTDANSVGSADYFNDCVQTYPTENANSVSNIFTKGYTSVGANTGNAYVGFFTYVPTLPNNREYVTQTLATPLTASSKYVVSLSVRLAYLSNKAISNIQCMLSTATPTQTALQPLPNIGQMLPMSSTPIVNKAGWTLLTYTFTANANYNHITIGNFDNDANTPLTTVAGPSDPLNIASYYFIDDVSIKALPSFSVASKTATLCNNSPAPNFTLIATPHTSGTTYNWSSTPTTASLSTQTGSMVIVSPTTTTTYTITNGLAGCTNTTTAVVQIFPTLVLPYFAVSSPTACIDGTIDVIMNVSNSLPFGSYNYYISPDNNIPTSDGNGNFYGLETYTTGVNVYTITVWNTDIDCVETTTISVYVNPQTPTYNIVPNPLCVGQTLTVSTNAQVNPASFGVPASYLTVDWADGNGEQYYTSQLVTTVYSTTGIKTLTITGNMNGCSNTITQTVNVIPNTSPTITITPTTPSICAGISATLTASGANTYTWTNSAGTVISTTSVVIVSPTVATTYTVRGANACGLVTTKTVQVSMIPNYTLNITANPNPVCSGLSTTLTASGGGVPTSYTWTPTTFVGNPRIVTPTANTIYTVSSKNSCGVTSSKTIAITVNPTPTVTAIANPTSICLGTTATLTAGGATTYTWMSGNSNLVNYTVSPSATTVYTLTGATTAGCRATKTVTLTVLTASPNITIAPANPTICAGQSVVLTASATGVSSYTWSTNETTAAITVTPATSTIYTVTGKNTCSLTANKSVTVTVKPAPSITISTPTVPSLCLATGASSIVTIVASPTPTNASVTWVATAGTLTIPVSQYTITGNTINYNVSAYATGTVPINFCATATSGGCSTTTCTMVYPCCQTTVGVTKYINEPFSGVTNLNSPSVAFGGTITVNSGASLNITGDVFLDPNTKFDIQNNATISIRAYMHGCFAMWDGIYANGASTVNISVSRIEDAKQAYVDLGNSTCNITQNYFNKNQTSIAFNGAKPANSSVLLYGNLFTCSNIPFGTPGQWVPPSLQPNLTNAPTFSTYPIATMLPPYAGKHSYIGIQLFNASQAGVTNSVITIGAAYNGGDNGNVFDKLKTGVLSFNSCVALQNNVFQNIKTSINNSIDGLNNIASAFVQFNLFGNPYNQIGGTLSSQKNTFINNDYGVHSSGASSIACTYNRFENQGTGVYVGYNSNGSAINVSSNKFINSQLAIDFYNNSNINATIKENVLTYSLSTAGNMGIVCAEIGTPANAKYNVYNNRLDGYYTGIYVSGIYSANINDNEVHMAQSGGAFQFGIQNVASSSNAITNNWVDMPSLNTGAWWQAGIFTDQATTPLIRCNTVRNLYNGIAANSKNVTAPGGGIHANNMNTCVRGFNLDAQGEIGNQLIGTNGSADNTWAFCTNETTSGIGSNTMSAQFFTRNLAPFNIINPSGSGIWLTGTNNSPASSITCTSVGTPTLNLKLGGASAKNKLMQMADEVADGAINFGDNDANAKHILRKQLYYHVMLQDIDPAVSPSINGFINSHKNKSIGKLWLVDSLLNTSDSSQWNIAQAINNSIDAENDADATQKQFNNNYITYLKNKRQLNTFAISELESIANRCPYMYGDGVHQARTVLFQITRKQYYNTCEFTIPAPSKAKIANTETGSNIVLYPNPNNGRFIVETNNEFIYELEVFNLLSEKLLQQTVINKHEVNLDNIPSSTYIVKLSRNGEQVKTVRICIIK